MLRIGFVFGSSAFLVSALLAGACSNIADDCEVTSTCAPIGGSTAGGSSSGASGNGGSTAGGSNAGDGGTSTAGASNGGAGTSGGEAGSGGDGGSIGAPCDNACTAPTPVCKQATDTCVECLAPADCTTGAEDKCDAATNTCVECLEAADCGSPTAARCDGGACVQCESNDDCDHIAGKGVCDAGTCVQCTVADETSCAGKSCNPATNSCTQTTKGTIATCMPCVADSECVGGAQADPDTRCMPMEFQGAPRPGGFCLRREAKTCARPYTIAISGKSLSEAPAESYCGIDQQNVTCEAVLDLIGDVDGTESCADGNDTSCGCARDQDDTCTGPGKGGLCRKVGTLTNRCTYQCGTGDDCPSGRACIGSPTTYCQ
jgi:hypothetical protein